MNKQLQEILGKYLPESELRKATDILQEIVNETTQEITKEAKLVMEKGYEEAYQMILSANKTSDGLRKTIDELREQLSGLEEILMAEPTSKPKIRIKYRSIEDP